MAELCQNDGLRLHDAEDLTQGFFARQLRPDSPAKVNRDQGKFHRGNVRGQASKIDRIGTGRKPIRFERAAAIAVRLACIERHPTVRFSLETLPSTHSSAKDLFRTCVLAATLSCACDAAIVYYEATGTFVSSDFSSVVALGDRFTIRLALDDSVADIDPRTSTAWFYDAMKSFQFSLSPGASGSYSGGSADSPALVEAVTAANVDWIYSLVHGDFGSIAGEDVHLTFYLLDYSHSSSISDLGQGQTLASVLGGTIDLDEFRDSELRMTAGKSLARATISELRVVPEPGAISLGLAATVIAAMGSRSRSRSQRRG
jgi:hypothetical protein